MLALFMQVHIACIMHDIPKTPIELVGVLYENKKKMLNAYKLIKQELDLEIDSIDPLDFVQSFGS